MRNKVIVALFGMALAVGALLVWTSGNSESKARLTESAQQPAVKGPRVLKVGETVEYELQPGQYRLTLKSVQRTPDGVQVQFLSVGYAKAEMDLNKEYALTRDSERMDDIVIAGPDSLTDPDVGEHKTVTMQYDLPADFVGTIVYVAYDGAREYAAFSVAVDN